MSARQSNASSNSFQVYKRAQAQISRRRLYPLTAFYTLYSIALLIFTLRSAHPFAGVFFYLAGILVWTLNEYLFHRFVLHGRFPAGEGFIRRFLHARLDPLHWEHHEHPFDGLHISGELKDLLPLFIPAALVAFLFPVYTLPVLFAGVVQSYVAEEWIHHSVHFYNFRNPYFKYIKRYHLYHHSPRGKDAGYGLTSGLWDGIFKTQYVDAPRQKKSDNPVAVQPSTQPSATECAIIEHLASTSGD